MNCLETKETNVPAQIQDPGNNNTTSRVIKHN